MKNRIRHKFILGLLLCTALFSNIPAPVFAAGETIRLTSASGTTRPGKSFTVSVDGHVGSSWFKTGATGVSGTLKFPANLLKVTSVNDSNATFSSSSTITPNNSSGTITFVQSTDGLTTALDSDVHLFTVTFQALANGTASVSFSDAKYRYIAGWVSASSSGGTYTISTPPPPPPPKPKPKPKPKPPTPVINPKPVAPPAPTPTPTPSPIPTEEEIEEPVLDSDGGLKIEDVEVTANRQENSVTWTVNSPDTELTFHYGTSQGRQDSQGTVSQGEDGVYVVELPDLELGTLYYFTIKAATTDKLSGATYSGTLTTRGYPVQLTVQQNGLLLPGAKVKIGERTFVANKDALILTELSDGEHTAVITSDGMPGSHTITFAVAQKTIPASGNPDLQSFVLNAKVTGTSSGLNSSLLLPIIGGIALIAAIAGIVAFTVIRRRQTQSMTNSVDTDLITSSYGSAVEQLKNTPEPQLDMMTSPQPTNSYDNQINPSSQMYPEQPLSQDAYMTAAPEESYQEDPSAQPDPYSDQMPVVAGADNAPQEQQYDMSAYQQQQADAEIEQYTETQELSPEVVQVESSQEIDTDEPSAVYDEATGALSIIHHPERQSPAEMTDPLLSESTPVMSPEETQQENPDTATMQSDAQTYSTDKTESSAAPQSPLTVSS